MTVNLLGFELGEVDSQLVESERQKASAFKRAGTRVNLPLTGTTIKGVTGLQAYGVGEGKTKTASGKSVAAHMGANKSVQVTVETKEAWNYSSTIADAILTAQPTAHATLFDKVILGLAPVPADWKNFVVLKTVAAGNQAAQDAAYEAGTDIRTIEIPTGEAATVALDDVEGAVAEGVITAYVLTTAMLAYLKRQRIASTGARAFDIVADGVDSGTINGGTPYYTVKSSVPVGVAGDFSKFYFGDFTFEGDTGYDVKDAGNITDSEGVEHNLTSDNEVALFNEVMQGAQVLNKANFVRFVPATVA